MENLEKAHTEWCSRKKNLPENNTLNYISSSYLNFLLDQEESFKKVHKINKSPLEESHKTTEYFQTEAKNLIFNNQEKILSDAFFETTCYSDYKVDSAVLELAQIINSNVQTNTQYPNQKFDELVL